MNKLILAFMFLIFSVGSVSALGISPGRTSLNYEPGALFQAPFSIVNDEAKNVRVNLHVEGDLSEHITLSRRVVELTPEQSVVDLSYDIIMPPSLGPGLHTVEIIAIEEPGEGTGDLSVISNLGVVSQVYVYVPYPGKYVDFDVKVLQADRGSIATVVVPVINRGQGINSVRARIDVRDANGESVETLESKTISLGRGVRTELSARWNVDVPAGDYIARTTVIYDGESKSYDKEFRVREGELEVTRISASEFSLGEVVGLNFLLKNNFNRNLNNVYLKMRVMDERGEIAQVVSSPDVVPGLSEKEVVAYFDTSGVEPGDYAARLSVFYEESHSLERDFVVDIGPDSIIFEGLEFSPEDFTGRLKVSHILIGFLVVLLIVNVIWFLRKKSSKVIKR